MVSSVLAQDCMYSGNCGIGEKKYFYFKSSAFSPLCLIFIVVFFSEKK